MKRGEVIYADTDSCIFKSFYNEMEGLGDLVGEGIGKVKDEYFDKLKG